MRTAKIKIIITATATLVLLGFGLGVTPSVAQSPLPPADATLGDEWLTGTKARLQTLDKITARIATIEVDTGVVAGLGTLELYVHSCVFRPPEMPPDHAALLEIRAKSKTDAVGEVFFFGWMFASSPAVSALEHPVYDISVLSCSS